MRLPPHKTHAVISRLWWQKLRREKISSFEDHPDVGIQGLGFPNRFLHASCPFWGTKTWIWLVPGCRKNQLLEIVAGQDLHWSCTTSFASYTAGKPVRLRKSQLIDFQTPMMYIGVYSHVSSWKSPLWTPTMEGWICLVFGQWPCLWPSCLDDMRRSKHRCYRHEIAVDAFGGNQMSLHFARPSRHPPRWSASEADANAEQTKSMEMHQDQLDPAIPG